MRTLLARDIMFSRCGGQDDSQILTESPDRLLPAHLAESPRDFGFSNLDCPSKLEIATTLSIHVLSHPQSEIA
jgi:hypothetical protein